MVPTAPYSIKETANQTTTSTMSNSFRKNLLTVRMIGEARVEADRRRRRGAAWCIEAGNELPRDEMEARRAAMGAWFWNERFPRANRHRNLVAISDSVWLFKQSANLFLGLPWLCECWHKAPAGFAAAQSGYERREQSWDLCLTESIVNLALSAT
jgi:hypothetical protein